MGVRANLYEGQSMSFKAPRESRYIPPHLYSKMVWIHGQRVEVKVYGMNHPQLPTQFDLPPKRKH